MVVRLAMASLVLSMERVLLVSPGVCLSARGAGAGLGRLPVCVGGCCCAWQWRWGSVRWVLGGCGRVWVRAAGGLWAASVLLP